MQSSSGQRSQVELLRAREAAARLGVKLETLYAYVSRGLLRSVAVPGSRERHYRADDVELFRASRGGERGRETLIPVIDSAICLIEGGRFFYRGHDAVRLAATVTLEEAAALLWRDEGETTNLASVLPRKRGKLGAADGQRAGLPAGLIERIQVRLATLGAEDLAALDLRRAGII